MGRWMIIIPPAAARRHRRLSRLVPAAINLNDINATLTIRGSNFRPVFEGGSGISRVTITQGNVTMTFDQPAQFASRSFNELVVQNIDTSQLVPGEAQVQVTNTASNLSSNAVTLLVEEGAGAFRIDQFLIDPVLVKHDPSRELSAAAGSDLHSPVAGENLTAAGMDIYVNEVPFVLNGVAQNIDMVTETLTRL